MRLVSHHLTNHAYWSCALLLALLAGCAQTDKRQLLKETSKSIAELVDFSFVSLSIKNIALGGSLTQPRIKHIDAVLLLDVKNSSKVDLIIDELNIDLMLDDKSLLKSKHVSKIIVKQEETSRVPIGVRLVNIKLKHLGNAKLIRVKGTATGKASTLGLSLPVELNINESMSVDELKLKVKNMIADRISSGNLF